MEKTIEQKSESISDNINVIAVLHFKEMPVSIERVTIGLCNEVFDVKFKDREVIVRLSQKDVFMKGSQKHIPILKERGINVPDILAEDYTKINIPYSYPIGSYCTLEPKGCFYERFTKTHTNS